MTLFDETTEVFPSNAIELISTRTEMLYPDLFVIQRMLNTGDPTQSVGIYPLSWAPNEASFETGGYEEPTLQKYTIGVQAWVIDADPVKGIRVHSVLSKVMRSLLYNDAPLRIGLDQLQITMFGKTEKIQRRGVARTRYLSNEVKGNFMHLSTIEYWLETQTQ
jgi:hypothetical protein